jgi:hypothetical protein
MSKRILLCVLVGLVGCSGPQYKARRTPARPRQSLLQEAKMLVFLVEAIRQEQVGCGDAKSQACFEKGYQQATLEHEQVMRFMADEYLDLYYEANR